MISHVKMQLVSVNHFSEHVLLDNTILHLSAVQLLNHLIVSFALSPDSKQGTKPPLLVIISVRKE